MTGHLCPNHFAICAALGSLSSVALSSAQMAVSLSDPSYFRQFVVLTLGSSTDIYHATDRQAFFRQLADFELWAAKALTGPPLDAVNKLCAKADDFALAFDHPTAYRTSNMIDRHMIPLDRWLCASRYFHGNWASAELQIRAWVLLHDFMPFCPRAKIRERALSPAHQLNRFVYHENWLHNLLISTSSTGLCTYHRKC